MSTIMVFSVLSVLVWQSYLKRVLFSHNPEFNKDPDKSEFLSPVCGEVVYILDNPDMIQKGIDRFLQIPDREKFYDHYQVGIFMSQYDNHHVVTPGSFPIKSITCIGHNSEAPMLKFLDKILLSFGIKFLNWLERSADFISVNQQYILNYGDGIYSILTMDKVVNKFDIYLNLDKTELLGQRQVLGFVKRGSQMDFFIPKKFWNSELYVGRKINFDSCLFCR